MPTLTLRQLVEAVGEHSAPVVYLDTCGVLDVLRSPFSSDPRSTLEACQSFTAATKAEPREVWLVCPEQVIIELTNNVENVAESMKQQAADIDQQVSRYLLAADTLGVDVAAKGTELAHVPLIETVRDIVDELASSLTRLEPDAGCKARAFERLLAGDAPARRKKGEAQDCVIVEHCLESSRLLNEADLGPRRLFVSSNRSDYCEAGLKLFPELEEAFLGAGLTYGPNLPWAAAELRELPAPGHH